MRWLLLLSIGCTTGTKDDVPEPTPEPDTEVDSDTVPVVDTEVEEPACPPLAATAEPAALNPLERGIVRAEGGEAPYTFRLGQAGSSPILSESTGEYLSGEDAGTDVVVVTDTCGQEAEVTFVVVPHLEVIPTDVTMPVDTSLSLSVDGGSNDVSCTVVIDASEGTLSGCQWTSGRSTGTDVIHVVDGLTGDVIVVSIAVREQMQLEVPELVVALQPHPVDIPISSGSGHYDLTVTDGDAFLLDGMSIDGAALGEAVVTVQDQFLPSLTASIRAVVIPPQSPVPVLAGWNDSLLPVVAADLDGDGYDDAIVSQYNANTTVHRGGIVMVYRGTADGLDPTPIQQFEGTWREGLFGRSLAVGDLSGDGIADLVIGEEQFEHSTGRVLVYMGVGDGSFSTPPWIDKRGAVLGDRMGSAVSMCDIDGDGQLDLLIGARTVDDRTTSTTINSTGELSAWTVSPSGLSAAPLWSVLGAASDGDRFLSAAEQLGRNIRTGDVDGDGRCDVVASALGSDTVVVYASSDAQPGAHLPGTPSRVYEGEPGDEDFDYALELADLDGDGLDDVIAGGWRTDGTADQNRSGGAYIFFAADDDGRPALEPVLRGEASLSIVGSERNEELGVSLGVANLDTDGVLDLFIGGVKTDADVNDSGGVMWFSGADIAASEVGDVLTEADAIGAIYGEDVSGAFGLGAAYLPLAGAWVVTEGRSDRLGPSVGDIYVLAGDTRTTLSWPTQLGGAVIGWDDSMTLFDDGGEEPALLIASPGGAIGPDLIDAGQITQFSAGTSFDWFEDDDITDPTTPDLRASMETGWRIGNIGDIDQDGIDDLAVITRSQRDRPDVYDEQVDNFDECSSGASTTGMLSVYRGGQPPGHPDYLVYGPAASSRMERLASGDLNGDGYGDVVFTSIESDPEETLTIAYGRALGVEAVVLCDRWTIAPRRGESFGDNVVSLGDVDGDDCDDIAVSAPLADPGGTNRGAVWVLFGWGDACATDTPRHTGLAGPLTNGQMGHGLAVGDINDDGTLELLMGAPDEGVGRVYAYPLEEASLAATEVFTEFADADVLVTEVVAEGRQQDGGFGETVAVVSTEGAPWIAVGEPFFDMPGGPTESVGLVHLLRHDGTRMRVAGAVGLDLSHDPAAAEGGELGGGLVGLDGTLLIGAPYSSATYTETGAVYRLDIE